MPTLARRRNDDPHAKAGTSISAISGLARSAGALCVASTSVVGHSHHFDRRPFTSGHGR